MSDPVRVMLVDDHAVVRAGYRRLIELESDLQVASEHADADAAYAALQQGAAGVDVLVLDLSMPGRSGFELMQRIATRWPHLRCLVFSMHDSPAMVAQALAAGACGFVTKSSSPETLIDAVRRVARGETVLSPDAQAAHHEAPHRSLAPREFDVFRLLVEGASLEDIAQRLHLSPKTVANHQTAVRNKLGVSSGSQLLKYAQRHGLAT
jgi:DNA-binding NarL/FixJ family response regulator